MDKSIKTLNDLLDHIEVLVGDIKEASENWRMAEGPELSERIRTLQSFLKGVRLGTLNVDLNPSPKEDADQLATKKFQEDLEFLRGVVEITKKVEERTKSRD